MWIAPPDADIDSMDADAELPDGGMSAAGSGRVDHGDEPFPTIVQAAGLGLGLERKDAAAAQTGAWSQREQRLPVWARQC